MNFASHISVFDFFKQTLLATRESAMLLMACIEKSSSLKIEVDFAEVTFISRSFADQFYKEQTKLYMKEIVVTNADTIILQMLKAVSRTQRIQDNKFKAHPYLYFDSSRSLKRYLLTV